MAAQPEKAEQNYEIVPNPKGKADVWKHFGLKKRKQDGTIVENIAVCRHCDSVIIRGGGTTNLLTHIRRHHPHTDE